MEFVEQLTELAQSKGFNLTKTDTWWYFRSDTASFLPLQGWKIHISASPNDAADILAAVVPVLRDYRVSWKVAPNRLTLTKLLTPPSRLEHVAKFITVYPENEKTAMHVAQSLYRNTRRFSGPVVASDRRYLDSRVIYYRYGSFVGRYMYTEDALRVPYMLDDNGKRVRETRLPGHYRPEWVRDPFPVVQPQTSLTSFADKGIKVVGLLKQSVKGGVYLVEKDGVKMVMKEGRFGTAPDQLGRDARDRIRNEYRILTELRGLEITPDPIDQFSFDNNEYILMEFLKGQNLRNFMEDRSIVYQDDRKERERLMQNIAHIVDKFHSQGILIGDLSPNNVFVTTTGCKILDMEVARSISDLVEPLTGKTPGYFPAWKSLDGVDHDIYAFGAILFFICTGIDPYVSSGTSKSEIEKSLRSIAQSFLRVPQEFPTLQNALGLMQVISLGISEPYVAQPPEIDDIGADLSAVMETALWDESEYLFRDPGAETFHPVSFYGGATGVAYVLWEYWITSGRSEFGEFASRIIEWILHKQPYRPEEDPPGLYYGFGALPLLMALVDYATYKTKIHELVDRLIPRFERDDITHGRTGFGISLMRLFELTGEQAYADAASALHDRIAPDAPMDYLGFAHGIAGLTYFELALGHYLDKPDLLELAVTRLGILSQHAVQIGRGTSWRKKPGDEDVPWSHWCHGAAGVGEVFLTAGTLFGDQEFLKIADKAGSGIALMLPNRVCGQCHGIAGDGEFMLRLARTLGTSEAWSTVKNLRQRLMALMDRSGNYSTWPGEASDWMGPTFMTGVLGVYSFLLRFHTDRVPPPLLLTWKIGSEP